MTSDGKYILSPMALLFPELAPVECQQMVESIAQRGLQNPITRWREQIIDGRHRYEACLLARVEPRFQDLPDDANPLELVMDQNAARRHMSESQRAIAAYKLFEASSGDWAALDLPGVSANLQRFSLAAAAERFNVSRRSVSYAGRATGRDSRAVPALKQAAGQGSVTVSDASRAVNQPPEIQLRALELVRSGTARTIASAVKRVLQEILEQGPEKGLEANLPEQLADRMALHRSTVGDLHRLVDRESVDAIITFPPTSKNSLALLPDLASFAAHSLKPTGVLVMLASVEHLPGVLNGLKHPDLHWVCEFDYIFGEPSILFQRRGPHRLDLRRRPLLVFGKSRFRLRGGDDLIRVPQPEEEPRSTQRLEAGWGLIVQKFTSPGQVVCDPIMLERASIAIGALAGGCTFIGADKNQSSIDRVLRRLASAGITAA